MPDSQFTVLAIGAHPDDVEFGCGGVLLVEAARGSAIALCVCSRGEAGSNGTPDERESEARAAAKLLGARMQFLDLGGDCRFDFSPNNAIAIARVIREVRPQVLLSPTAGGDQHPDHIVLSQLCRTATRLARYGGVGELRGGDPHSVDHHLEYAITRGAEPSDGRQKLCVDISAYYEPWMELMACHQTQLRTRRYLELQIARARSLGLTSGVEYAQALFPYNDFLINHLAELPPSVRLF